MKQSEYNVLEDLDVCNIFHGITLFFFENTNTVDANYYIVWI